MVYVMKGYKLPLRATVDPGLNQTVSQYKWSLDGIIVTNNTSVNNNVYSYLLDTSLLSVGKHIVSFYASNACGKDLTVTIEVNVTEVYKMDMTVVVDKPVVDVSITVNQTLKGTIKVTAKDQSGNPVLGLNIVIKDTLKNPIPGLTAVTDANGLASIPDILYGTYILSYG